jgi:hypothetical protein
MISGIVARRFSPVSGEKSPAPALGNRVAAGNRLRVDQFYHNRHREIQA